MQGAVVPKKSLTKKKVYTHTNGHINGKDESYIPPHTSYAGDIIKRSQVKGKENHASLQCKGQSQPKSDTLLKGRIMRIIVIVKGLCKDSKRF